MNLRELMQRAKVWRAGEIPPATGLGTGFAALDSALHGRGWPQAALTELLFSCPGIGALRLVLPAIAKLSRTGRWIIWVAPPYIPYSPALSEQGVDLTRVLIVDLPGTCGNEQEQALWAFEQALRFSDCGAALVWLDEVTDLRLRRLQLAAESGDTWGILFRPERFQTQASPAALRLKLSAGYAYEENKVSEHTPLEVEILKVRGGRQGARCRVEL